MNACKFGSSPGAGVWVRFLRLAGFFGRERGIRQPARALLGVRHEILFGAGHLPYSTTLPCESSTNGELPLRRECIVGAHLKRNDSLSITDRRELLNRLAQIIYFRANSLVTGLQIRNLHSVYGIYRKNCPNKDSNFEQVLVAASGELGSKVEVRIMSGGIEPGAETIDVFGPWWRDGESTSNQA